jgi:hypothetical protein
VGVRTHFGRTPTTHCGGRYIHWPSWLWQKQKKYSHTLGFCPGMIST